MWCGKMEEEEGAGGRRELCVCGGVFEWLTTKPTPRMYIYTTSE